MAFGFLEYIVSSSAFVLALFWLQHKRSKPKLPLPPGPPRWPLIGSLLSLPRDEPGWKVFERWGKEKGSNVIYVPVAGNDLVILNSYKAATELLENRSSLYSGRPRTVMAGELVGWNRLIGLCTYNDWARRQRRFLHNALGPKAMEIWHPLQEREARKFLQRLLHNPQDLVAHIRQTSGSSTITLTYGYTVRGGSDEFLTAAEDAVESITKLTVPGAFMVDLFPWLQYVPWAPFKKFITEGRKCITNSVDVPLNYVRERMNRGEGEHSLMSRWLEQPSDEADYEYLVKWCAAALYIGGADTTVSAVTTFFIAMLYNPLAKLKAQAEISQLVPDRLPTLADRARLPYVEALYKEVLRWQAVVPLGLPHSYMGDIDDEYEGMRIPAGATVIANVRAMLHDPSTYADPEQFKPERFLGPNPDHNPEDMAFGFGRRSCPGIHVAQASVWLSIALTLAAYDISPAAGKDGKEVLPSLEYSNLLVSHPPPFKCNITPRSERMKQLIEDSVMV